MITVLRRVKTVSFLYTFELSLQMSLCQSKMVYIPRALCGAASARTERHRDIGVRAKFEGEVRRRSTCTPQAQPWLIYSSHGCGVCCRRSARIGTGAHGVRQRGRVRPNFRV